MPTHQPRDSPPGFAALTRHTPNCPGGPCDDPATAFLCDVCGGEFAACCGVSESETCDDCEGKKMGTDIRYYCYDNECGFEEYDTEELARSAAEELLDNSTSNGEFSEDDTIEYGALIPLGRLVEKNRRDVPRDEQEREDWRVNGWSYVADHELEVVRTLNQHMANEYMRLKHEVDTLNTTANDLRAKLEESLKPITVTAAEAGNLAVCYFIGTPVEITNQLIREVDGLRAQLAIANETIASLRQRDTVRPAVSLAEVYAEGFRDGYQARDPDGYTCEPTNGNPYKGQ